MPTWLILLYADPAHLDVCFCFIMLYTDLPHLAGTATFLVFLYVDLTDRCFLAWLILSHLAQAYTITASSASFYSIDISSTYRTCCHISYLTLQPSNQSD